MYNNIHVHVLKRMLLVWFLMSVLLGGAAYFLEISKVNELVLSIALDEATSIDRSLINQLDSGDPELINQLQANVDPLVHKHFKQVEIYLPNETHLVIAQNFGNDAVAKELERRHHNFPLDRNLYYDRFSIDDMSLIQVLLPLKDNRNRVAGYFEGVYHIEDSLLENIENRVYQTLGQVLLILLALSLAIYPVIILLNRHLFTLSRNLLKANVDLLEVLGSAIAMRDSITNSHNYRVTLYALKLGEKIGLKKKALCDLLIGAFLHDVGKIGVSDTVLQKGSALDAEEMQVMRHHVSLGQYIIEKSPWLSGARDIIQYHHEKYDGTGYLNGLRGEQIPIAARIFAIVDVFDALTTKRSYKEAFDLQQSLAYLREERGTHFDPTILDSFLEMAEGLYGRYNCMDIDSLEVEMRRKVYKYFLDAGELMPPDLTRELGTPA